MARGVRPVYFFSALLKCAADADSIGLTDEQGTNTNVRSYKDQPGTLGSVPNDALSKPCKLTGKSPNHVDFGNLL